MSQIRPVLSVLQSMPPWVSPSPAAESCRMGTGVRGLANAGPWSQLVVQKEGVHRLSGLYSLLLIWTSQIYFQCLLHTKSFDGPWEKTRQKWVRHNPWLCSEIPYTMWRAFCLCFSVHVLIQCMYVWTSCYLLCFLSSDPWSVPLILYS
jgi:hypothetical protein